MKARPEALEAMVARLFVSAGCGEEEAHVIADHLVEANLAGHDSHGVIRVPIYLQWMRESKLFANRSLKVLVDTESLTVADGQLGFGQWTGKQSVTIGIEKCRRQGLALVALRNCAHLGRIGTWAEMAAAAGLVSLHFVNTSRPVPSESGIDGMDYRTIRPGAGPFNMPTNLVTGPQGDLFITDGYGNARVHRFTPDGGAGGVLGRARRLAGTVQRTPRDRRRRPGHVGLEHASTTRQPSPRKCRATATADGWLAQRQVRSSRFSMPNSVWYFPSPSMSGRHISSACRRRQPAAKSAHQSVGSRPGNTQ